LIFLGGGTATLAGVSEALALGASQVAIVEKRPMLGGECALSACLPTHLRLFAANTLQRCQKAAPDYGILPGHPQLDYPTLKALVEARIQEGPAPFDDEPRVQVFRGEGRFLSPDTLEVLQDERATLLTAPRVILATGASAVIPNISGLSPSGYSLYPDIATWEQPPQSLIILGGGRIGVEMAQLFQRLGSQVTLLERARQLLHREEPELAEALLCALQGDGIDVRTNVSVQSVAVTAEGKRVDIGNGQTFQAEQLLLATGRSPDMAALRRMGLEAAGVAFQEEGVVVDACLHSTQPNIWAAGDCVGPYRYTHVADYQTVVAVRNALTGIEERATYQAIPFALYTDPPLGRVGLSEAEARAEYGEIVVIRQPAEPVKRYRLDARCHGILKLIIHPKSHLLLGAHLLADRGDDIIHFLALAIQEGISVNRLHQLVYAYPSRMQIVQKALEQYPRAGIR
jgi:pyruvate/2-oxoglutarate dehydrogenase complex dihydrolipoamide dehydrogenase (E3) component